MRVSFFNFAVQHEFLALFGGYQEAFQSKISKWIGHLIAMPSMTRDVKRIISNLTNFKKKEKVLDT